MFIFFICFTFGPADLSGYQEAMNIFNIKKKKPIHKCSVEKDSWGGGL